MKPVSKADQRKNLEAMRTSMEDVKLTIRRVLAKAEKVLRKELQAQPNLPGTIDSVFEHVVDYQVYLERHPRQQFQTWLIGLSERDRWVILGVGRYCLGLRVALENLENGDIPLALNQCLSWLVSPQAFAEGAKVVVLDTARRRAREAEKEPLGIKQAIWNMFQEKYPPKTAKEAWEQLLEADSEEKVQDRWKMQSYLVYGEDDRVRQEQFNSREGSSGGTRSMAFSAFQKQVKRMRDQIRREGEMEE